MLPQTSVFWLFVPILTSSLCSRLPWLFACPLLLLPRSQSTSPRGCVVAPAPQLLKTPQKYPKVPAWCAAAGREASACTHRQQAVFLLTGHANWLLVCTRGSPGAASCAGTPGGGRGGVRAGPPAVAPARPPPGMQRGRGCLRCPVWAPRCKSHLAGNWLSPIVRTR